MNQNIISDKGLTLIAKLKEQRRLNTVKLSSTPSQPKEATAKTFPDLSKNNQEHEVQASKATLIEPESMTFETIEKAPLHLVNEDAMTKLFQYLSKLPIMSRLVVFGPGKVEGVMQRILSKNGASPNVIETARKILDIMNQQPQQKTQVLQRQPRSAPHDHRKISPEKTGSSEERFRGKLMNINNLDDSDSDTESIPESKNVPEKPPSNTAIPDSFELGNFFYQQKRNAGLQVWMEHPKLDEMGQHIVALLNGGKNSSLIIGVNENGRIIGTPMVKRNRDYFRQDFSTSVIKDIEPIPSLICPEFVPVTNSKVAECFVSIFFSFKVQLVWLIECSKFQVILIRCPAMKVQERFKYKGKIYVIIQGQTQELTPIVKQQLLVEETDSA